MRFGHLERSAASFAAAALIALFLPLSALTPDGPGEAGSSPLIAEYVKRLGGISPRDAEGFYQLGRWCKESGLAQKAVLMYERAIRIDPDHPGARSALGYRPYGLGWTKTARAPLSGALAGEASTSSPPAGGESPAGSGGKGPLPGPSDPGTPKAEKKAGPGPQEAGAEAVKVEETVAAKKRWAEESAAKLELKLALVEDEDFLIHTTYDGGSSKLKALSSALKGLKRVVLGMVGRSRGPIWPGKLHFIYMRASTECMRFAEAIDGMRFPEEDGYYTAGDPGRGYHTVFSAIPEKALAALMGYTALERMGNSNRYVGRWLREGVGGLVAASTEEGKRERCVEQAFHRTALEIKGSPDGISLFKLLETQEVKPNAAELFEAQALTLVVFLREPGAQKLQKLIEELKSPEAPAPPAGYDKLFMSKYTAYQERALSAIYRDKLEKMNDKWKAYVLEKAAAWEKTLGPEPKSPKPKTSKPKTQKPGKSASTGREGTSSPPAPREGGALPPAPQGGGGKSTPRGREKEKDEGKDG